jgi:hypothetical protein
VGFASASSTECTSTLVFIEGTNEARIFVPSVGKAKLIDNWDVLGLRATAASTTRPTTRSCPSLHARGGIEEKRARNPHRIGTTGFAGPAIRAGAWHRRRVLDELIQAVAEKAGRPGRSPTARLPGRARERRGRRPARAFVSEPGTTRGRGRARREASVRQNTLIRLARAPDVVGA